MKFLLVVMLLILAISSDPRVNCARAATGGHGKLYVSNEESGDLSVIDVSTNTVVSTIPVGKRPRGIQSSPDHSTVYVALSGSVPAGPISRTASSDRSSIIIEDKTQDGIGTVDVGKNIFLGSLPGGSDPEQFAVSASGNKLYVANEDKSTVSIVDVAKKRIEQQLAVGNEPEGISVSPDGRWIYVVCEASNLVVIIDARSGKVHSELHVGARPRSVAFLPDSSFAYISLELAGAVAVVALPKHELVKTIPLMNPLFKPLGLAVAADGRTVYVTTGRGGSIVRIATLTNLVTGSVAVGERPWGIAISADSKTLYTANGPSNDVSVVDVATFLETSRIKVGARPWGLVMIP